MALSISHRPAGKEKSRNKDIAEPSCVAQQTAGERVGEQQQCPGERSGSSISALVSGVQAK